MDTTAIITFGEDEARHPEKYDIFTPDVKEYDTPGKYRVVLPGSENENEYMDIEVYENGMYNVLDHVVEPVKTETPDTTDNIDTSSSLGESFSIERIQNLLFKKLKK